MSSSFHPNHIPCPYDLPAHKCHEFGCIKQSDAAEALCTIQLSMAPEMPADDSDVNYFVQICAWCGKVLRVQALSRPAPQMYSHGICESCRNKILKERQKPN